MGGIVLEGTVYLAIFTTEDIPVFLKATLQIYLGVTYSPLPEGHIWC